MYKIISTQYMYEELWNDTRIVDLSDFKALNIDNKVNSLQEFH